MINASAMVSPDMLIGAEDGKVWRAMFHYADQGDDRAEIAKRFGFEFKPMASDEDIKTHTEADGWIIAEGEPGKPTAMMRKIGWQRPAPKAKPERETQTIGADDVGKIDASGNVG